MIVAAGVSHKTCPVELRERLAALRPPEALDRLQSEGWKEAVVLSTCNRFEVYAPAAAPDDELKELRRVLERWAGAPLQDHLYGYRGPEAIGHLLHVASGLDSLVLGEAEILGQVKEAYELSRQARMTGKFTNVLFQRALYVGKKVRSDTGIALGHTSVASVAVNLAERIFGSLRESAVLILGAGKMAELTSKHLSSGKISKLLVANRTWERGRELAERFKAQALRWEEFPSALEAVDIVIASTGAPQPVLTRELVARAASARLGRSLFIIDIAMPRDAEESVSRIDHVYLYTMADLEGIVRENLARRGAELEAARALVEAKTKEFSRWAESLASGAEISLRHSLQQP